MTQTTIKTAAQIRQEFLDFFQQKHRHTFVPSSPVVPHDDPTLLFANAGMNQFKDVFLGASNRDYTRAVNSQKCIRAGGKHNDLEDVGKDLYHHTFFEMLGNWSFGDYFKTEAIEWAWELLVNRWGLDPERMYATVFAGSEKEGTEPDVEAEELWKRFLPAERVSRWDKKDNFWEMGETGPCGPCSEVHYDGRSDAEREAVPGGELVNRDHPDVIEIWNLVFIQFNRAPGVDGVLGELTPLPAKHVDTGMGFERVVRVIQGKESNYDIDVWTGIFDAIREHTGAHPYRGKMDDAVDMAYRVIADHLRCLTVAICDGGTPGNEGRGYVLRRILRRAVRHAHQTLGVKGPVLHKLVPAVVESLGAAFPELNKKPDRIAQVVRDEEESFLRTLDRGIELFEMARLRAQRELGARANEKHQTVVPEFAGASGEAVDVSDIDDGSQKQVEMRSKGAVISADDAFKLHDTFGFPIDLTRVMAEERGMTVDEVGFEKLMAEAREISRKTGGPETGLILPPDALATLEERDVKPTDDQGKYTGTLLTAKIKAIWDGSRFQDYASGGTGGEIALILDHTNHYAESGGQVGDHGSIFRDLGMPAPMGVKSADLQGEGRFNVKDVQQFGNYVLHIGRMNTGKLHVGDEVKVSIQVERRRSILPNHTCTHLLNLALRDVLGEDVHQRGSLVAPDRLRFDFTNPHGMSAQEIEHTQTRVRGAIDEGLTVYDEEVPLDMAKQIHGLRAVFGERYPDHVRVVSIGTPVKDLVDNPGNPEWQAYSIELCGGTHLKTTNEADAFVIVHEQALAAGVRRILALTGPAAKAAVLAGRQLEARARNALELDDAAFAEEADAVASEFDHLTMAATARHRMMPVMDELRERTKGIKKQAASAARGDVVEQARKIAAEEQGAVIVALLVGGSKDTLLSAMDVIKAAHEASAVMLFAPDDEAGKVALAARVPDALIKQGLKAGDWVREAAKVCGGGGGGRPDMAQAGGKDPSKVGAAMETARTFAEKVMS